MKRRGSSDSLGALISICPTDEKCSAGKNTTTTTAPTNTSHVYSRGFQSMLEGLEEEDCLEESSHIAEKKRRLSVDQVKALEKNFEVENKLEPERKMKLAQELGLQPRQVAVWFQNRRARWKTKQLERDYGFLKSDYETLKRNFESLQRDKEALVAELRDLKSKLQEENPESEVSIKEEVLMSESENKVFDQSKISTTDPATTEDHQDNNNNGVGLLVFGDFKDGSSDSDSSAILNEDNNNNNNSPNAAISSSGVLEQHQLLMPPASSSLKFNCPSSSSPSSINYFQFSDSRANSTSTQKAFQHQQFLRMEEHNFFGAEDTCNFFSEDQAPTLQWYYSTDQWN